MNFSFLFFSIFFGYWPQSKYADLCLFLLCYWVSFSFSIAHHEDVCPPHHCPLCWCNSNGIEFSLSLLHLPSLDSCWDSQPWKCCLSFFVLCAAVILVCLLTLVKVFSRFLKSIFLNFFIYKGKKLPRTLPGHPQFWWQSLVSASRFPVIMRMMELKE